MKTGTQTVDIIAVVQEGSSTVEQLTSGLTFQRLYHGQIMAFRFIDQSRSSVDAWTERASAEAQAIPADKISVGMYDFSGCRYFSMSPYIRQRALEMSRRFKDVEGFSAVVVPKTPAMQLAALFLRLLKIKIQTRIFFTYEEGLYWLKENVDRLPGKARRP